MMSESDDTDVLLLIPPDLFLVPSSDSDDSDFRTEDKRLGYGLGGKITTGSVVSELFDQVKSLENRISVIESKDTSLDASLLNNSNEIQSRSGNLSYLTPPKHSELSSFKNKFGSVSQISSSLINTPIKSRKFSSVPTTPSNQSSSLNFTNQYSCDNMKSLQYSHVNNHTNHTAYKSNNNNTNSLHENKKKRDDHLMSYSEPSIINHQNTNYNDVRNKSIGISSLAPGTLNDKDIHPANHISDNNDASQNYIRNKQPVERIPSFSFSLANNPTLKPVGKLVEQRSVDKMELYEVDQLLHEMETTEVEIAKTINRSLYQIQQGEASRLYSIDNNNERLKGLGITEQKNSSPARRLDFNSYNQNPHVLSIMNQDKVSDKYPNISLPFDEESFHLDETDKMISDFKLWRQNCSQMLPQQTEMEKDRVIDNNCNDNKSTYEEQEKQPIDNGLLNRNVDAYQKVIPIDESAAARNSENSHYTHSASNHSNKNSASILNSDISKAYAPVHSTYLESGGTQLSQVNRNCYSTSNLLSCTNNDVNFTSNLGVTNRITTDAATNTEHLRKPQRLLTLSDFWETDPSKSQEDMLRIKLEEEKFRRDHCEHLIQELQKRLLEQQEKVAVAVRVDNEKNVVITRLQNAWTKLKLRWQVLEAESSDLHLTLKNVKDKHQMEYTELQSQIKRCEGELSKALDLAAGYKEKSDTMTKDKLDLLKSHADELENYKSLVQEAENRYSQLKIDHNKALDQNQQLGEALKNTQQEVNRERLRGGEVRGEMGVIHKALDACEAELIVLRQEKESLQLKLKEEVNRNNILEQNKSSFLAAIEEAKNSERKATEELRSLTGQQERMRIELREVYQKQVDEVVKAKLLEFQSQLDTAESAFQNELESRQRAIAECAARKIKTVLDKHQLEINLLEEKHKEEKRLCEIQLAQAMQQVSMLDAKLNTQNANKTQLAEQLHSVMQKQWQQALQIISGGNIESLTPLQRIHAEKFFQSKHPMKSKSSPNIGSNIMEPMKLESHSMPVIDVKNVSPSRIPETRDSILTSSPEETPLTSRKDQSKDDLRKYIKMILDMQQPKSNFLRTICTESNPSPTPITREVPKKHYIKKEESFLSEDSSVVWQPSSEVSIQEATEYISVPQKLSTKGDQQKIKPPWK